MGGTQKIWFSLMQAELSHFAEIYMQLALQKASDAIKERELPIGAIIVCGNKIIAAAHNEVEKLKDPTAHAEMLAITAACNYLGAKYLKDCSIYITLEPCPMCAAALRWAQIGQVIFGAKDVKGGYQRISHELLHPKTIVHSGLFADTCSQILKDFFYAKRG